MVASPFTDRRRSSISAAALLKDKLPTEMFISPSEINVSVVIGHGMRIVWLQICRGYLYI